MLTRFVVSPTDKLAKNLLVGIIVFILILSQLTVCKQLSESDRFRLDQRLEAIQKNSDEQLAGIATVAFAKNRVIYEGYFGSRFIDSKDASHNLPVNRNTKYRIASISKIFVAIGAMQLVEQRKLDLDKDISEYFGFFIRNPHAPNIPITTRMLLSHTSSIRDGTVYSIPIPYTVKDFFDPQGTFYENGRHWAPKEQPPGAFFHYDNLNFGLIGTLIETLSGERFDKYMCNHIFRPLNIEANYNIQDFSDEAIKNIAALYGKRSMDRKWSPTVSWYPQTDSYKDARLNDIPTVKSLNIEKKDIEAQFDLDDYIIGTNGTIFSPYGGLRISAYDLAKVVLLLCNSGKYKDVRLLSTKAVQQMFSTNWSYEPKSINGDTYGGLMRRWGLGIQIITNYTAFKKGDRLVKDKSLRYFGHAGEAYGILSGVWFDPESKSGFVYYVGGLSIDIVKCPGEYSSFSCWEEQIMTALYEDTIRSVN